MTKDEVFRIWAPAVSAWARWVKPVLFSHIGAGRLAALYAPPESPTALAEYQALGVEQIVPNALVEASYRETARPMNVAVIVDLPGVGAVEMGIALARLGFRPIPLFNAYPAVGSIPIVDVWPIVDALERAATPLAEIALSAHAPPAFLLDASRRGDDGARPGSFDNRSVCTRADFPTSAELARHGIEHVVLMRATFARPLGRDVQDVLLGLQAGGMKIHVTTLGALQPTAIEVPRLSLFEQLMEWGHRTFLGREDEARFGRAHSS